MKSVFVIWIKDSDFTAGLLYHLTDRSYTHAAISLDEDCACYYSFCFKGFCRETVEKYRRRGVKKSLCLRLEVTDDVYERLQQKLEAVAKNSHEYEYTKLGVICALLHIPFRQHRRYFCSQFVAELLESTGAASLSRPACLTLPHQLLRDLKESPGLCEIATGIV